MNLLTFRAQDIVYICDALEYGLDGFVSHGRAWTYSTPRNFEKQSIYKHLGILRTDRKYMDRHHRRKGEF